MTRGLIAQRRPAIELYNYQQNYLLDKARFKLAKFARQTGKTFTTTLEIVDDCAEHALNSHRTRWVILSRGERQAKEAMDEGVKRHATAYKMGIEEQGFDWKSPEGFNYRALEVTLPFGSKITALPANPDTARGFSANAYLDEFAFHRDSGAIWKALFPVISAGWKLRTSSTPNGKSGKFYELDTADDDVWSRHSVDIYQAVADGLPRDIDMLRAGIADEDAWAQEYELRYLDEASAWLSYELISSVEDEDAGLGRESYLGGPCYVGRDIGRRNDLHVITVLEEIGDVLWERERIEQKRATFADMDAAFDEVMNHYRVARACIDQTGMGEKVVEDAQRRYGARVEGVLFTSSSKLIMASQGKERFEDRTLRIPMGDVPYRGDLHKLRKISGPTGTPRFVAERDDDHADRTWALFLAINAAAGTHRQYGYTPAPKLPGRYEESAPAHRYTDRPDHSGDFNHLRRSRSTW